MYNGIINVYKEPGYTSFDVVARLRGILHQKKIGHTGTLDPDAEGVLPVVLGNATKLVDALTDKTKTYECIMQLGVETDTEDMSGTILSEHEVNCSEDEIRSAVLSFKGPYAQVPPMYSALKKDGKKLYELAREGVVIDRPPRNVEIFSICTHEINGSEVRMTVDCSRGTYIRSLCRDIGEKLGCKAAMKHLTRTKSGNYRIGDALKLSEIERAAKAGEVEKVIIPTEDFFMDLSLIRTDEITDRLLENGNPLKVSDLSLCPDEITDGLRVRVHDSGDKFFAVYFYKASRGAFMPEKMFI